MGEAIGIRLDKNFLKKIEPDMVPIEVGRVEDGPQAGNG